MTEYIKLNNNITKPQLGFGTADLGNRSTTIKAIQTAFEVGYRHFDTATLYNNEKELGEVIKSNSNNIDRKELFITSKLWNSDHGYEKTKSAFSKSLDKLGLEYLDLYLTHWPVTKLRNDSWKAMEELTREGKIKAIGVSNYTIRHLQELLDHCDILPVINQVEFNPFLFQNKLLEFCKENNTVLEAYSPIMACVRKLEKDPVLISISEKYKRSIAQVAIRWSIQLGNSVIPRSSNPGRIKENYNVFDFHLSQDEMNKLSSLNEDLRLEWDPTDVI